MFNIGHKYAKTKKQKKVNGFGMCEGRENAKEYSI